MIAFYYIIHILGPKSDNLIPFIEPHPVSIFTSCEFLIPFVLAILSHPCPHLPNPPYKLLLIRCLHSSPPPSADLSCHLYRPLMHLSLALNGAHCFPHHALKHMHVLILS